MKRLLLSTAFALALMGNVGCANKSPQAPALTQLQTCKTYDKVLEALLPLREDGVLNASTLAVVDGTRDVVDPLCLGPVPDVNSTVKNLAIDGGVRALNGILVSRGLASLLEGI